MKVTAFRRVAMSSRVMLIVAIMLLMSANSASAYLIKDYVFDGTVTRSQTSLIPVGTAFHGSFSINFDAPIESQSETRVIYSAIQSFNVSYRGLEFIARGGPGLTIHEDELYVQNLWGDFIVASNVSFGFQSPEPFPDLSLNNLLDLEDWGISGWLGVQLYHLVEGVYVTEFFGSINNLSLVSVPEPGSLLLFSTGLVIFLAVSRQKRRIPLARLRYYHAV